MTLNNFNPTREQLARAKVLRSPELRNILEEMEGGAVLYKSGLSCRLVKGNNNKHIGIRNIRTLLSAGLIDSMDFDDYIEYRLTYDPKITSIKDVK